MAIFRHHERELFLLHRRNDFWQSFGMSSKILPRQHEPALFRIQKNFFKTQFSSAELARTSDCQKKIIQTSYGHYERSFMIIQK